MCNQWQVGNIPTPAAPHFGGAPLEELQVFCGVELIFLWSGMELSDVFGQKKVEWNQI